MRVAPDSTRPPRRTTVSPSWHRGVGLVADKRVPYMELAESLRRFTHAINHTEDPLRVRELRMANAIVGLTYSWTKYEDGVTHAQLAEAAHMDESHVRKALRGLEHRALIIYTPGRPKGRGHGVPSTVGIHPRFRGAKVEGDKSGPGKASIRGPDGSVYGGQEAAFKGDKVGPLPVVGSVDTVVQAISDPPSKNGAYDEDAEYTPEQKAALEEAKRKIEASATQEGNGASGPGRPRGVAE